MANLRGEQGKEHVFALDIGTRSIIGLVGRMEEGRLHVLALEQEDHGQRAMLDGQIEDIDRVAEVAARVRGRLETRLQMRLKRVCVAAAGRALQSERASFSLEYDAVRRISDDMIGQLEAGAATEAEKILMQEQTQQYDRFFMVGYTVVRYVLDGYPLSTLRGHSGRKLEAELTATFLPQEVVESLYAVVGKLGLEVASLTLEPIASLNAAIPADIRLLNLVLVDIGAGTSDIAVCRDGSVVGYTMATVAGDEITEQLMRRFLIDFQTGERVKREMGTEQNVVFEDILGISHELSAEELWEVVEPESKNLAREISRHILELNGKAPSAVFLAGGGSKLSGLRGQIAAELKIDQSRVAVAGHHFARSAFAEDFELDDPEYATPLGIAISAAMGLINDSYIVLLNGRQAKLFQSGALTIRDILLMNGYRYSDLIARTGANMTVTLNGERCFLRGAPGTPPRILLNGEETELSAVVHAGDDIAFTPAKPGKDAPRRLRDILGEGFRGSILVNGAAGGLDTVLHTGDEIWADEPPEPAAEPERPAPEPADGASSVPVGAGNAPISIVLNDAPLQLPAKASGEPYFLMDLLEYSGLDLDHLTGPVEMMVNGVQGQFSQKLRSGDQVSIGYTPG